MQTDLMYVLPFTHADLISDFSSNKNGLSLNVSAKSIRVYISVYRSLLMRTSIDEKSAVSCAHFASLGLYTKNGTKYSSQQASVIKHLYRRAIKSASHEYYVPMLDLVGFCLLSLTQNADRQAVYERYVQIADDVQDLAADLTRIEVEMQLDIGTFGSRRIVATRSVIPKEWWPEGLNGDINQYKRKRVVKAFKKHTRSSGGMLNHQNFLLAIADVENLRDRSKYYKSLQEHRLSWPMVPIVLQPGVLREYDELCDYKFNENYTYKQPSPWTSKSTSKMFKTFIKSYLTFINSYGRKFFTEEFISGSNWQSISCLINFECFTAYLRFGADRAGGFNTSTTKNIKTLISLVQPDVGWLWLNERSAEHLPIDMLESIRIAGGWQPFLVNLKKDVANFQKNVKNSIKPVVRSENRIRPILDSDKPMICILKALDTCRDDLILRKSNDKAYYIEFQSYVIMVLMLCSPLRSKNWGLMTYSKTDRLANHLRKSPTGPWEFCIPVSELKNGHSSKDLKGLINVIIPVGRLEWMKNHLEMVDLFINEYRRKINETDYLFCTNGGSQFSANTLGHIVRKWTKKYLAEGDDFPSQMDDVLEFSPHQMRRIVATHYCKQGDFVTAALMLIDSEAVTRAHYVVDDINRKFDRAYSSSKL
jgi:hypothetical protein